MDYAKRAEEIVELRNPDGEEPHGPSTWIFGHWIDTCEDPKVTAAALREKVGAELRAAHDAGVVEGKAGERALEMFVVRSLAHEVDGGDDKTAEQLIEMLLAERDAARSAGVAEERARCAAVCEAMVVGGRAWDEGQEVAAEALFAAAENIMSGAKP